MATSLISVLERRLRPRFAERRRAAFSLVEVTLAIGIVAFAFTAVFGLMPVGMTSFRGAMDASIGSQITETVVNDAQQTDFDQLIGNANPAPRYFDGQGTELTAQNVSQCVYKANTVVKAATAVPGTAGATNADVATVIVQVARSPGSLQPATDAASGLWAATGALPVTTSCSYVARNSPANSVAGQ